MAKKTEPKIEKIEKEYDIQLREKCRPVPRYKKTPKADKYSWNEPYNKKNHIIAIPVPI